jgi:hypothetical protein
MYSVMHKERPAKGKTGNHAGPVKHTHQQLPPPALLLLQPPQLHSRHAQQLLLPTAGAPGSATMFLYSL